MTQLTQAEQKAVDLAGQLYALLTDEIVGHEATREADLAELCAPLHLVQWAILAQCAARAYPGAYRLLGEVQRP